jgi:hypothetical protein
MLRDRVMTLDAANQRADNSAVQMTGSAKAGDNPMAVIRRPIFMASCSISSRRLRTHR